MAPRKRMGNPFQGVMDMMSEMSRLSDQMTGTDSGSQTQARGYVDAWNPTTDILAKGPHVVIRCELPGVEPEDVEVAFSNGTLSISGERQQDGESDELVFYVRERFWGRFRRDIALPEGVQEDQIEARFDDGLLEITVRDCAEAAGPSQIQVQAPASRRSGRS